jgi:hypothetical protein
VPRANNGGGTPFRAVDRESRKTFNCTRLVGVELEYNKTESYEHLNQWYYKWRGGDHSDGSCGREIVTAPLAGDYLVNCMNDLGKALAEDRATADERCGIHVHVDASDAKWADMYRLLQVYARVEPLLYLLGGQQRITNQYCKAIGHSYANAVEQEDRKGAVLAVAISDTMHEGYIAVPAEGRKAVRRIDKKHHGRYKGLNIMPWLAGRRLRERTVYIHRDYDGNKLARRVKRGISNRQRPDCTVEFRLHQNSLDAGGRVLEWAKLCAQLVEWCLTHSDKEVQDLPKSALRILCIVAPSSRKWMLTRIRHWRGATKVVTRGRGSLTQYRVRATARRIKINKGVWQCAV